MIRKNYFTSRQSKIFDKPSMGGCRYRIGRRYDVINGIN